MHVHVRRTLPSLALLAALLAGPALAAAPAANGLGQAWPNTTDVSANPNWHVYVFARGSTRYIQINDAQGVVRGAFARTPYSLVGLPIGTDAGNLSTPDEPLPAPASRASVQVYSGDGVQAYVAPQADGTARLMLVPTDCKSDPIECNKGAP
ncbi:hypothetical protein L2Y96_13840 [Luteibacter aegosomaticola]|uniref:hypothetical protein n=1 Tax=Luteibacter aegosomaticola TaxID=2911538 RepID=UPI001FFC162D|nr:hypothetical protein [Luteibacter aegosomaticola]UPG88500.1 hypothetical protein L2Y96_13840 [Luteibacter aegosomaticola]